MYKKLKSVLHEQINDIIDFNHETLKDIKNHKRDKNNYDFEKEMQNSSDEKELAIKVKIICKDDVIKINYFISKEVFFEE